MIRGWLRNYLGVKECECKKEEQKKPIEINLVIQDKKLDFKYISTPAFKENFRTMMKILAVDYYRANEFMKMDVVAEVLGYFESAVDGTPDSIIQASSDDDEK